MASKRTYVNNYLNRKLGRVGKPLGSMPVSMNERKKNIQSTLRRYEQDIKNEVSSVDRSNKYRKEPTIHETEDPEDKETVVEMFQRLTQWQLQSNAKMEKYKQRSTSGRASTSASTSAFFQNYKGRIIEFKEITLDEKAKIGHGGFRNVFAGTWERKRVAVKKLQVQTVSEKRLSQFQKEVKVFSSLNDNNVIEFYGACIEKTDLYIVTELMKCSLHNSIHQHEHQYTDKGKLHIAKKIADGIDYLHSQKIFQCGIKTKNILLDIFDKKQLSVKVAHSGLNLMKNDAASSMQVQGRYSAPEVLKGELFDVNGMQMADIYSYGLVLFALYSEEEPFEEMNIDQLRSLVEFGKQTPPLDKVGRCGQKLIEIMGSCCEWEPTSRPKMSAIKKVLSKIVIRKETGVLIEV